jgi:hypothetical protein
MVREARDIGPRNHAVREEVAENGPKGPCSACGTTLDLRLGNNPSGCYVACIDARRCPDAGSDTCAECVEHGSAGSLTRHSGLATSPGTVEK